MLIYTVPFELHVFPKFTVAKQTIYDHLSHIVDYPFVVPFLLQTLVVTVTKAAPEFSSHCFHMRALHMFVQHGFEIKLPVAVQAGNRAISVMVIYVSDEHFFGVEFALAHIALEVDGAVDFLVLREV